MKIAKYSLITLPIIFISVLLYQLYNTTMPVEKYTVSTYFSKYHQGVDLVSSSNNVYSPKFGIVENIINDDKEGLKIVINHGFGIKTEYSHLQTSLVNKGEFTYPYKLIAYYGNSGMSAASHLHYSLKVNGKYYDPNKHNIIKYISYVY